MSTTLQDVILLTQDYVGNYGTGANRIEIIHRAINRSIEYNKRMVGLPNDESIYSFYFSADQFFYDLPANVIEPLYLTYNKKTSNNRANRFEYFNYPDVLQGIGNANERKWSMANINGKKQLIISARNEYSGQLIFSLDDITNWTASDDASDLSSDTNQKYQGTASIAFDITNSAGYATLTFTGLNLDIDALFERYGFIKLYTYMTDNNIDAVTLRLQSSAGNYHTITVTLADDGTAFAQDEWQKIGFDTQDSVITGTPDNTSITQISIEFELGLGFTSAADFRIDNIFTSYPDKLDLIYLSNVKGTDTTGATEKTTLDNPTDILWYSDDYDDFTDLIAQRAAINLWPHLKGDKEQFMLLKNDYKENLKSFARRYPRKRVAGSFSHYLRR